MLQYMYLNSWAKCVCLNHYLLYVSKARTLPAAWLVKAFLKDVKKTSTHWSPSRILPVYTWIIKNLHRYLLYGAQTKTKKHRSPTDINPPLFLLKQRIQVYNTYDWLPSFFVVVVVLLVLWSFLAFFLKENIARYDIALVTRTAWRDILGAKLWLINVTGFSYISLIL